MQFENVLFGFLVSIYNLSTVSHNTEKQQQQQQRFGSTLYSKQL